MGRFLNVGGSAVSIGGGGGSETILAYDYDVGAWRWASGALGHDSIVDWSTGSTVALALGSTGVSLTGATPMVILATGATDKSLVMASTGTPPALMPRWVDSSNFVLWNPQLTGSTGRLRSRSGGVNTDETSATLYSSASNWGFQLVGNTLNLYGNGSLVATRTITAHASSTKAAIGHQSSSGSVTITRLQNGTVVFV